MTLVNLNHLMESASDQRIEYAGAQPFPNLVIDNFCDPDMLREAMAEIPFDGEGWKQYQGGKRSFSNVRILPRRLRETMEWFRGHDATQWLRLATGIPDLTADKNFGGAGIHATPRGGRLGVHVDFNQLSDGRYRRLNAFLFLNEGWQEEWGGHLELWDMQKRECIRRIAPLFNRFVMFGSTETSHHGHPGRLKCPADRQRLSFAWYYFSRTQPADFKGRHSTLYVR